MEDVEMRPIPGWEGKYSVDSDGNVYSENYRQQGTRQKLTPRVTDRGYETVRLCDGARQKVCRVHRLVALAFIPNPEQKSDVDHVDFNRRNNKASNLQWRSHADNIAHSAAHKRWENVRGENHPHATISLEKAQEIAAVIRGEYKRGDAKRIAAMFGTTIHIVRNIRYKNSWSETWKSA